MSGHSKWSTIKHKKAKEDAKRGKVFTKLIKEITVAARESGGDPSANPRLRTVLDKAKAANMPSDNITRAIKKGTGELPGVHYENALYEGYGPNGTAVIVEVLTENKNRAVSALRHVFSSNNGHLAESGAVNWMFERLGVIRAENNNQSEDEILEKLIDYDIKNIELYDGIVTITCNSKSLDIVKKAVQDIGLNSESAEIEWVAKNKVDLGDDQIQKVLNFLHALEELEDVQNVYTNLG